MRASGDDAATAYLASSAGLSDGARLPTFDSALDSAFFIGFIPKADGLFTVSVPDGYETRLHVALCWCSDNDDCPADRPADAVDASLHVSLTSATGPQLAFSANADTSWTLNTAARTCVKMEIESDSVSSAMTFDTLELQFVPPQQQQQQEITAPARRRRAAGETLTFIPSFPSFAVFKFSSQNGTTVNAADLEGAATTQDLVPPWFLSCPPALSKRTFDTVNGSATATVQLAPLTADDFVTPIPEVELTFFSSADTPLPALTGNPPLYTAELSAIGASQRCSLWCWRW